MATVQQESLTVQELHDRLDALTRAKVGLTADQFIYRCRRQQLDMTSATVSRLASLARLIELTHVTG